MKKLILFLLGKRNLNWNNFFYNFISKLLITNEYFLFMDGKINIQSKKTSSIVLKNGNLYLNKKARVNEPYEGFLEMNDGSKIICENHFDIQSGCNIILMENAIIRFGSGYINRNVKIRCFKEISIGENVAISENVTIWDSDAHELNGKTENVTQPITIGNNVWIGTNVIILKGVTIGDGAVVAAGSLVNKNIPPKCLAAGVPAKVVKENVNWK